MGVASRSHFRESENPLGRPLQNVLSSGWIPAFAGMTGVSEGIPSQMTPGPIFQLTRELLDYRFTLLNLGVYRPFWWYEGDGKSGYRPEQRRPF